MFLPIAKRITIIQLFTLPNISIRNVPRHPCHTTTAPSEASTGFTSSTRFPSAQSVPKTRRDNDIMSRMARLFRAIRSSRQMALAEWLALRGAITRSERSVAHIFERNLNATGRPQRRTLPLASALKGHRENVIAIPPSLRRDPHARASHGPPQSVDTSIEPPRDMGTSPHSLRFSDCF